MTFLGALGLVPVKSKNLSRYPEDPFCKNLFFVAIPEYYIFYFGRWNICARTIFFYQSLLASYKYMFFKPSFEKIIKVFIGII